MMVWTCFKKGWQSLGEKLYCFWGGGCETELDPRKLGRRWL